MSLLDGIVACWSPSLGVSGNRLLDRSGYCNHGTLTNMDPPNDWVRGPVGVSLDYDGVNDFADFGTNVKIGGSKVAAFSMWVYPRAGEALIGRYNTSLGANLRADYFGPNTSTAARQVTLFVGGASTSSYLWFYSTEQATLNAWNHVAGSVIVNGASSTCVMSLNGKPCTVNTSHSGTLPTAYADNNVVPYRAMVLTGQSGTLFYYNAILGEIAIWRASLPVGDLCSLHKRGNGWIGRELSGANRRRSRRSLGSSSRRRRLLLLGQE